MVRSRDGWADAPLPFTPLRLQRASPSTKGNASPPSNRLSFLLHTRQDPYCCFCYLCPFSSFASVLFLSRRFATICFCGFVRSTSVFHFSCSFSFLQTTKSEHVQGWPHVASIKTEKVALSMALAHGHHPPLPCQCAAQRPPPPVCGHLGRIWVDALLPCQASSASMLISVSIKSKTTRALTYLQRAQRGGGDQSGRHDHVPAPSS